MAVTGGGVVSGASSRGEHTPTTGHRGSSERRRGSVTRAAVLLAVAVVGSFLVLPIADVATAPPAGAAEIPTCAVTAPLDTGTNTCLMPSTLPDPAIPAVVTTGTRITVGFPDRYYYQYPPIPNCPVGIGDPAYRFSCPTMTPGRSGSAVRVLAPSTDPSNVKFPSSYGLKIERTRFCSDDEVTCDYIITFNPALVTGTVTILWAQGVKGPAPDTPLEGWDVAFVLSPGGAVPPSTSFDATQDSTPGAWRFSATSTDPQSLPLTHEWNFGDGTTGLGTLATHTYAQPGTYDVTLTSRNTAGVSSTATKQVVVEAATLGVTIQLLDGAVPPLEPDEPVRLRATVSAGSDGVGAIDDIAFADGALVAFSPADAFAISEGPTPAIPAAASPSSRARPEPSTSRCNPRSSAATRSRPG